MKKRVIATISIISIILIALIVLLVIKFTQGTAIDLSVQDCFYKGQASCNITLITASSTTDTNYSIADGRFIVEIKQAPKWLGCSGCSGCSSCYCGSGVSSIDEFGCPHYSCYARSGGSGPCLSTWDGGKGGGSNSGAGKGCTYSISIKDNGIEIFKTPQTGTWTSGLTNYLFGDVSNGTIYSLKFGLGNATGDVCNYITGSITTSKPSVPCGNGKIDSFEACDANSIACTVNNYKGTQICNPTCTGFNACIANESYGDGMINGNEICDGNNFGSITCQSSGFKSGNLTCQNNGTSINTSNCRYNICGNGILEAGEVCDSDMTYCLNPLIGNMSCKSDCSDYDNSTCKSPSIIPPIITQPTQPANETITTPPKSNMLPIIIGTSIAGILIIITIIFLVIRRK